MRRDPLRLLILGGTTEASRLAHALAGRDAIAPVLSLAGRTANPALPPIRWRIGGFGGVEGLIGHLVESGTQAVVDATHPFAARMSAHAEAACAHLGLPLAVFSRPAWRPEAADRWTPVDNLDAAALALGPAPHRVFLATGRLGLLAFRAAPQHWYVVRTIDPPDTALLPPDCRVILGRGPFGVEDEIGLLREERIDVLVSKNSGGAASFGKIAAARHLGLPVVMVECPPRSGSLTFADLGDVLGWIEAHQDGPEGGGAP